MWYMNSCWPRLQNQNILYRIEEINKSRDACQNILKAVNAQIDTHSADRLATGCTILN